MKKLLYIVTQGEWGGAQRYIYDLAGSPEAQNWTINVAFGNGGVNDLGDKLKALGVKIWPIKWLQRPISPIADILAIFELWRLYRQVRPDVVHLNSSKAGVVGSLASFLNKITGYRLPVTGYRVVYTAHGWVFNEPMSRLKKQFYLWAERFTARFKDKIICVSEFDRQVAIKNKIAPEEKLVTIHNGIDAGSMNFLPKNEAIKNLIPDSKFQIPNSNIVIGTIANFYPTKGLDYLIKAVRLLITDYRLPITAIIIGDGELRPQLENLIAKYNLQNNVFLVGRKENALQYLKAFDIYVCSSVKEGFPYSILEAMAAGLSIVSASVGGIPEMIENEKDGLLVEPKNAEKLAMAIKLFINNKDYGQRLAEQAGQSVKEKFSKNQMTEKIFKQYN